MARCRCGSYAGWIDIAGDRSSTGSASVAHAFALGLSAGALATRQSDELLAACERTAETAERRLPDVSVTLVADWWQADNPCPAGTELKGGPPPDGTGEVYCQEPGGTKEGPYVSWHFSTRHPWKLGRYNHGRQTGVWQQWDADGQLEVREQWRDGVQHGRSTYWRTSSSGSSLVFDGMYRDGARHGFARVGEDCRRACFAEGFYCRDRKHGPWSIRDAGGAVRSEGRYHDGYEHGIWNYRGSRVEYRHGVEIGNPR